MIDIGDIELTSPSQEDRDTLKVLEQNGAETLEIVRGRADKWLGGLTALSGVLTTALVIKGPDSITDFHVVARVIIGAALVAGAATLGIAVFKAYSAAFGAPGELTTIPTDRITGLAEQYRTSRETLARDVQKQLTCAVRLSFAALALITLAVTATWFIPADTKVAQPQVICIAIGGELTPKVVCEKQ